MTLFRVLPSLASVVQRVPLCDAATPAVPLSGHPGIWVKDDSHCGTFFGGCKTRKLEFILGRARARGATHLVTAGALGTHHGLATARAGMGNGFSVTVLLVPQPWSHEVEQNLDAMRDAGARLIFARTTIEAAAKGLFFTAGAAARGDRLYWIASGGSSLAGHLGFVDAGLELAEQIAAGLLPVPDELFIGLGTGGCSAGLLAGLAIAGLPTKVVGVRTSDVLPVDKRTVLRQARRVLKFLRRRAPEVPTIRIDPASFVVDDEQLGAGLGAPTAAGRRALGQAADAGLTLDMTYTAKCFAALMERRRHAGPGRKLLFWNTHADALGQRHPRDISESPRLECAS